MQWLYTCRRTYNQCRSCLQRNNRFICNLLRYGFLSILFGIISFFVLCRLEVNAHVYLRNWLSPPQPVVIEPLSSCFSNISKDSPYYQGNQKFTANFVPGLPVWEAYTCYDFAALFRTPRYPTSEKKQLFHTYWSSNTTSNNFSEKQLATLRSFAATQNTNHTLTVWIQAEDEALLSESENWNYIQRLQRTNRISFKVIDPVFLTENTPIEAYKDAWRSSVDNENDGEGRDDLLRMLVLYQYGGVWFDLDTMFIRDLSPLFEHEWIAQGSCSTGMFGNPFTGALFHFKQKSPYVCEILEGAADLFKARDQVDKGTVSPPPKRYLVNGPEIFGSKLYYRVYRRILHHGIKPWSILPWCFTDPSQCRRSNSLPSLFKEVQFEEKRVLQIFAYHWRDRWSTVPGAMFKYLDSMHNRRTNW